MTTLVASLSACVTGCGLTALPLKVQQRLPAAECSTRSGLQQCSAEASAATLWCLGEAAVKIALGDAVMPTVGSVCAGTGTETPAEVCVKAPAPHSWPEKKPRFDLQQNTVLEVTPYAEVYGVHPRQFDFGRGPGPAPCFVVLPGQDTASGATDYFASGDVDEDAHAAVRAVHVTLPWWCRLGASPFCCFVCFAPQSYSTMVDGKI